MHIFKGSEKKMNYYLMKGKLIELDIYNYLEIENNRY